MTHNRSRRYGYFFGYGADQEVDMIRAITGHVPRTIGRARLRNYELRIQKLSEITTKGENPQKLLRNSWGDAFESYVIVPKKGASINGILFRMSIRDRHLVDEWELIQLGWYRREFVTVELTKNHKKYTAETQVLESGQQAREVAPHGYRPWLMSKSRFLTIARHSRFSSN